MLSLPSYSVIVVNHDGGAMLDEALASISSQEAAAVECIVVDNGSRDEERRKLRSRDDVVLLEPGRDLGFAAAIAAGLGRAAGDWIALVNNDVVLAPDWAGCLLAAATDEAQAIQGLVTDMAGDHVDTLGITFDETLSARPVGHGDPVEAWATKAPCVVSGPSATAALYRRSALQIPFPADFFAYYEDVDLALRLVRRGRCGVAVPAARARHRGSVTGRRRPARRWRLLARNRLWTLARNLTREATVELAGPIRRGSVRTLRTAWREDGPGAMAGAWLGLAEGVLRPPPVDRESSPRLGVETVRRLMAGECR